MTNLSASSIIHQHECQNLDESIDFYKNLFGFEIRKDDNSQNKLMHHQKLLEMILSNYVCMRYLRMSPKGGIAHFGFSIENFDDILQKCKEFDVQVLYDGPIDWEKSPFNLYR